MTKKSKIPLAENSNSSPRRIPKINDVNSDKMNEMLKLAKIGNAGRVLADACYDCGVSIELALPMILAIAQKQLEMLREKVS